MTISQALSSLGDAVRNSTWKTDKMSISDMTAALNLSGSLPNLATPFPVMNDGKGHSSTANADGSQSFTGQGGFTGELVHVNGTEPTVALKKGDTLVQAFTMKTDILNSLNFNFRGSQTGNHVCLAHAYKIADNTYRIWATYMSPDDETYTLLEFWSDAKTTTGITLSNPYAAIVGVGGVAPTNLIADPINFTTGWANANTIPYDGYKAIKVGDYNHSVQAMLETGPNHQYKWTFWARADNEGNQIHTELFGGGGATDITLTTEWKQYSVTGTTSTKQILFFWSVSGNPVYLKWPYLTDS